MMTRAGLWRALLASCFALLVAVPALARTPDPSPEAARQILVMLRLAPPHLRAGGDYRGGYGDDMAQGARRRMARRIARTHGLTLVDNWPMPMLGVDCFIMTVPDDRTTAQAAQEVAADAAVLWSEPVETYSTLGAEAAHEDPLFPAQPAARSWRLAALHRRLTGRGVHVAVIDSGVDTRHPDLAGQVALARNFAGSPAVAEAHGTAVAGIIAARADNGVGIVGVAPGARILALRACQQARDGRTLCDSLSLARALQFAIEQRADIINMSLAGPPGRLLADLLRIGLDRGATIVAAYDPSRPGGGFPASQPGVIAVRDDATHSVTDSVYSAPGQDIPAPQPGGQWTLVDGSSFSAAHMSGLFALLREQQPQGAPMVVRRRQDGQVDICASFKNLCAVGGASP